jgi:hypothetical protein
MIMIMIDRYVDADCRPSALTVSILRHRCCSMNNHNAHTSHTLLLNWWQGVELWYNDQNYGAAMLAWEQALHIRRIEWNTDDDPEDDCLGNDLAPFRKALEQSVSNQRLLYGEDSRVCRLFLFLAGCYLDSGRFDEARKSLRACLRDGMHDSETCIRAIQEYMSSFEEDSYTREHHCKLSQRLITIVQTSESLPPDIRMHWSDPYLRPGFQYRNIAQQRQQAYFLRNTSNTVDERPSWCTSVLEQHFEMIRDEFLSQIAPNMSSYASPVGSGSHRDGAGAHDSSVVSAGQWTEFVVFGSGEQPHLVPQTSRLLQEHLPDAVSLARSGGGEVIFSILAPHTKIDAHCGTTNLRLTAHLGIQVPTKKDDAAKCRIRVGDGQWHYWEEGKVLVFDDAYEHEVENLTDEVRVVLLLRFWHPGLAVSERRIAMEQALQQKQEDTCRRFNPPLPMDLPNVEERTRERSHCHNCGQTGYASLRVASFGGSGGALFVCACGSNI